MGGVVYIPTIDAAELAGTTRGAIHYWIRTGLIRARKNRWGIVEVARHDILALMEKRAASKTGMLKHRHRGTVRKGFPPSYGNNSAPTGTSAEAHPDDTDGMETPDTEPETATPGGHPAESTPDENNQAKE